MKRIWVDKDKCLGCKTCELQCAVERNSTSKSLLGAIQEDPKPVACVSVCGPSGSSFPLQCRHCEDAACISTCPSGAAQRDPEHGNTYIDQTKCRGCWMCVMSCPFGVIIPSVTFKVAMKCDACVQMEEAACVASCPTGALIYGDEASYSQVLIGRRGRIATFAKNCGDSSIISLDFVQEDE